MFQLSGEEIASIVVVAGLVVLYFRTLKDRDRERRERIELKKEVLELAHQLGKALREQEQSALKARPRGDVVEEQGRGLLQKG